jgi:large subunit ribosomal protein L24
MSGVSMMMKIRKGDRVRVMRGDAEDKGKVGEVIRVLPKENRIVVQGVNLVKKHQRQTQSGGKTIPSGIREFEAPIHISNVQLVTEASEKAASKEKKAAKPVKKSAAKPAAKASEAKPTSRRRGAAKPAADESGSEKLGAGENK